MFYVKQYESYCLTIVIQVTEVAMFRARFSSSMGGRAHLSHQRMKGARTFPYFPLFGEEAFN